MDEYIPTDTILPILEYLLQDDIEAFFTICKYYVEIANNPSVINYISNMDWDQRSQVDRKISGLAMDV